MRLLFTALVCVMSMSFYSQEETRLALGSVLIDGYAFLSKDNITPQEGYIL